MEHNARDRLPGVAVSGTTPFTLGSILSLVPAEPVFDIAAELRGLADEFDRGERETPDTFLWIADGQDFTVGVIGMASPASVVGLLHIAAAAQAREAIEE